MPPSSSRPRSSWPFPTSTSSRLTSSRSPRSPRARKWPATGAPPRELRFLRTDAGLVAFLTLGLDAGSSLDDAHTQASEIEARIRAEEPEIADVVVHTEPAAKRPVRQGRT